MCLEGKPSNRLTFKVLYSNPVKMPGVRNCKLLLTMGLQYHEPDIFNWDGYTGSG